MPLVHGPGAVLRSVKLHSPGGDALRARQRLERALADVDWSPPGLGQRALLFVRRLVADGTRGVRPASEGGSFGQGVSAALRQHASAARRPWLHADAAQADAVCFSDEAELLACLLRDWVRGALAQRWWWQGVLGPLDVTRWLGVHALAHGEHLVPALALLAERGEAVDCVAKLDDPDAVQAVRSVRRAYGLSEMARPAGQAQMARADDAFAAEDEPAAQPPASETLVPTLSRLLSLVPELKSSHLRPPQRRLLGLALALVRAPGWARTRALAVALDAPEPAAGAEPASAVVPAVQLVSQRQRNAPVPAQRVEPVAKQGVGGEAPMPTPAQHRVLVEDAGLPASPLHTVPNVESYISAAAQVASPETEPHPSAATEPPPIGMPAVAPALASPPPAAMLRAAQAGTAVEPSAAPHTLRTRFGGVFYLLNAALALRVYGDFTMPRTPGLALSPWDLLAWTGRAWFGDDFARDPVWALLASMSGRKPATPPGPGFAAPERWKLDAAWLAPWGPVDRLQLHAGRQRLRVLHPQGFAVFDVPRDPALRPLQQARALCAGQALLRAGVLVRACRPVVPVPRAAGARWLHHWLLYLNARLARTLGADDAPALLCRHDAVIELGSATVDVHLSLADLPLPVRFAGLDRDPGWIPAAGRSLMFRFT